MDNNLEFFEKPSEGGVWDVAIIGSGPSGLTAAIYTTRGAASTLVLAGDSWGGQLMLTTEVDNFPGFPEGIQGPELMAKMRKQAERFHAEIVDRNVTSIDTSKNPFEISTSEATYKARSIIIATGAETRWLGVPGEEKLRGRGVSSCAPCDAPFFKDKEVLVVGGGDSAMEEALVLSKYASKVVMIHRRDAFRASAAMQQKVLNNEKISVIWDSDVIEMLGEAKLEKVKVKTKKGTEQAGKLESVEKVGEDDDYIYWLKPADGIFVAIGHSPATEIFKDHTELDAKGYVVKQEKDGFKMTTSVDGVFVAGDVHDYHYRQAITASAFGCMAAMEILKFLDKDSPSY